MPVFGPANNRIDPQIDILIDRLCTERNRNNPARKVYLSGNAQKIKKCVAGYTDFNLMHRVMEFVKSLFGASDWQLARNTLHSSLVGRNFTIFVNDQANNTADKILGSLAKSNQQNVCVSAILSYDRALRIMSDELVGIAPARFELGQYELNPVAPVTRSNPRLLFN